MSVWLASLRRLQKESCMAYSSFWGLQVFFLAALPPSLPLPSHGLFLHETVFSSFMRALAVGFRSHPGIQDDLMSKLLYLIPASKTLFSQKDHICSLQGYNVKIFGEATIQPHQQGLFCFRTLFPHMTGS